MRVLPLLALLALSAPGPGAAQASARSILVQVTEAESGSPIPGAFVSLLDYDGQALRSALTNASGRMRFPVAGPGTFRIRAEMIGRQTRLSAPVEMVREEAGQLSVSVSLSLPVHAIPLDEIRIEATERCRTRPDEATRIYRVWEEARKALTVQAWAEEEGLYRFHLSLYERDLDARGRRVQRELRRQSSVVTRTPVGSLPVEELMAEGFVRPVDGGGHQYYGPDATVLLSGPFLDSHCFRLIRSGDHPGSVGLAFEPVERGHLADIRGTIWLDQESAALQSLEYRYTEEPHEEGAGRAGGRVEFESLPDGGWIIGRWWIRVPILAVDRNLIRGGSSGIWVAGIRETGGEVSRTSTLTEEEAPALPRGAVAGIVWDSIASAPLGGAAVHLLGTDHHASTDAEGRFLIEGVAEGLFTVAFTHPRLDSLGIFSPESEVQVGPEAVSELLLSVPSSGAILLAACNAAEREEGGSVLTGFVRDRRSRQPIPGASVRVEWQEVLGTTPTVRARERWFEVTTDGGGRYTACGIPLDEALLTRASLLSMESDPVHLRFLEEAYRVQDFEIDLRPGLLSTQTEARTVRGGVGVQGVQGVILDPESKAPVQAAAVSLRQSPGSLIVTSETDSRGFFRLQTPVPGSYLLSAQALGYSEVRDEGVTVAQGKLTVLELRLAPAALTLEPIVVLAEPRAFHLEMQGFYQRQELGLDAGVFLSPEILEERQPHRLTDLFFEIPGTRVVESQIGGRAVYFRGGERVRETCWPMVYLDRHLISPGGFAGALGAEPTAVDDIVPASDVAAVEVYRSPAEIPPEFGGANSGCGVVVIWTRLGGGL